MMTLTEARDVAKRARRYGYFTEGNEVFSAVWLRCPQCRQTVRTEPDWRAKETRVKALDRVMVAHLRAEYDDERCPGVA